MNTEMTGKTLERTSENAIIFDLVSSFIAEIPLTINQWKDKNGVAAILYLKIKDFKYKDENNLDVVKDKEFLFFNGFHRNVYNFNTQEKNILKFKADELEHSDIMSIVREHFIDPLDDAKGCVDIQEYLDNNSLSSDKKRDIEELISLIKDEGFIFISSDDYLYSKEDNDLILRTSEMSLNECLSFIEQKESERKYLIENCLSMNMFYKTILLKLFHREIDEIPYSTEKNEMNEKIENTLENEKFDEYFNFKILSFNDSNHQKEGSADVLVYDKNDNLLFMLNIFKKHYWSYSYFFTILDKNSFENIIDGLIEKSNIDDLVKTILNSSFEYTSKYESKEDFERNMIKYLGSIKRDGDKKILYIEEEKLQYYK